MIGDSNDKTNFDNAPNNVTRDIIKAKKVFRKQKNPIDKNNRQTQSNRRIT